MQMNKIIDINKLPKKIAIFPLSNLVFFPKTILPLNIFEKRYIQLVNDAMKSHRLFGMIQPKQEIKFKPSVYKVGCLGKVVNFEETNDNRFIINLSGIIRFNIKKEHESNKLYREFEVDYSQYENDLIKKSIDKKNQIVKNLLNKIKNFFDKKNYVVSFKELEKLDLDQLINTICMISNFSAEEKQMLIETVNIEKKIELFEQIIDINLLDNFSSKTIQ